jgi:hypothetical protein
LLDVLAALRRDQDFEPLPCAVDADRDENLARDRHGFFKEQRRIGIFEIGEDQPPRVANLSSLLEGAHQAALAAPAFEDLRFEQEARPACSAFRYVISGSDEQAPRHGKAVTAQQGFFLYLGKTHNLSSSHSFPPGDLIAYQANCSRIDCVCCSSMPTPGGWW